MKYVWLVLLAIVSVIHLIDRYHDDTKKGARTKGFLLPLILLYYIASVESYSWLLIFALITSWLGDVLLIPQSNKWFAAGGISFLISHFLFIFCYVGRIAFDKVIWYIVIPVAAVYFTIAALIIKSIIGNIPKMMKVPMFGYLIGNSLMNVFALMQLISNPCAGSAVAYVGAILFFISDCSLFLVKYHKNEKLIFKKHFTVMLTYILGELLITQGIIMLTNI